MLPPSNNSSAKFTIQTISQPHTYQQPTKQITTPQHLTAWLNSVTHHDLLTFIGTINTVVKGRQCTETVHISPHVQRILDWLDSLQQSVTSYPPIKQDTRYGNKGYRNWFNHMTSQVQTLNEQLCSDDTAAFVELNAYLCDSFGNQQRIDYGTGHELNFLLYMLALYKICVLVQGDMLAVGLKLIKKYLELMQTVQLTYYLEPAGSKGAWGLDDYQFIIFFFGAAQLTGSDVPCSDITNAEKVKMLKDDYLLFSGIDFIHKVKSGPFYEHSVMLYQISQLASWTKANNGLIAMYNNEVLNKFPIVQHILFGSILTLEAAQKQQSM